MNFRITLAVLLVALGLAAYVYFVEIQGGERSDAERQQMQRLLPIAAGSIKEIRLHQSREHVVLVRHRETFVMVSPVNAPCDPAVLQAFMDTLQAARREENVGSGELARYGLDAPAATLELVSTDGSTHRVRFGQINPLQTLVYVLVDGSQDVWLTTSSLLTLALTSEFGWRDKRLAQVDPEAVQRMRLRVVGGDTLAVARSGPAQWPVPGPVPWRADPVRAQSLLLALCRLEAVGVAAESKEKLQDYGLDVPKMRAVLEAGNDQVLAELLFGVHHHEGSIYGMVPAKPEIFRVDQKVMEAVNAFTHDPRDRKLFQRYLPSEVKRIEVESATDRFVLVREGVLGWAIESSTRYGVGYPIDADLVSRKLEDLLALEVTDFPAAQPRPALFDPAEMTIRLVGTAGPLSGIQIGRRDPNGLLVFCRGLDEPAVFLVSPMVLIELPFDLDRFKPVGVEVPPEADRS